MRTSSRPAAAPSPIEYHLCGSVQLHFYIRNQMYTRILFRSHALCIIRVIDCVGILYKKAALHKQNQLFG